VAGEQFSEHGDLAAAAAAVGVAAGDGLSGGGVEGLNAWSNVYSASLNVGLWPTNGKRAVAS
jgi:hypothetical protein